VSDRVVADLTPLILASKDPVDALQTAAQAWVGLAGDPVIQRVVLVDAPSVLGWDRWRAMDEGRTLGAMRELLRAVSDTGQLAPHLVEPFAHMLLAALDEIALVIARADDTETALAEGRTAVGELLNRLLRS
jgi:hypothetical protein